MEIWFAYTCIYVCMYLYTNGFDEMQKKKKYELKGLETHISMYMDFVHNLLVKESKKAHRILNNTQN